MWPRRTSCGQYDSRPIWFCPLNFKFISTLLVCQLYDLSDSSILKNEQDGGCMQPYPDNTQKKTNYQNICIHLQRHNEEIMTWVNEMCPQTTHLTVTYRADFLPVLRYIHDGNARNFADTSLKIFITRCNDVTFVLKHYNFQSAKC